jgi:hypothetical protein
VGSPETLTRLIAQLIEHLQQDQNEIKAKISQFRRVAKHEGGAVESELAVGLRPLSAVSGVELNKRSRRATLQQSVTHPSAAPLGRRSLVQLMSGNVLHRRPHG